MSGKPFNRKYKPLNLNRPWREIAQEVIFEADTFWGRFFDIGLLWAIFLSVFAVMLESVHSIYDDYHVALHVVEWFFTVLFTIEYALRIYITNKPFRYIFSFFGIVDLLAVLPTYIVFVFANSQYLLIIRVLRLMRIFRVLKLVRYSTESEVLAKAIYASRRKIIVFLGGVLSLTVILGTFMHLIEGQESGFTSIPTSIYWAIVTLTTVGYGDIAPQTVLGQTLAAFIMIIGYSVIAVPTGIVSVEYSEASKAAKSSPETIQKKSGLYCYPKYFKGFYLKDTYR